MWKAVRTEHGNQTSCGHTAVTVVTEIVTGAKRCQPQNRTEAKWPMKYSPSPLGVHLKLKCAYFKISMNSEILEKQQSCRFFAMVTQPHRKMLLLQ